MSYNTWVHRIARPVTRRLVDTKVTPNHLTALRLLTGLSAALLLAGGDPFSSGVAGALFLLSFLLDRASPTMDPSKDQQKRIGEIPQY